MSVIHWLVLPCAALRFLEWCDLLRHFKKLKEKITMLHKAVQGGASVARPDQLGTRSCGGLRHPLFRLMRDIL